MTASQADEAILSALQTFANEVTSKLSQTTRGEPEEQLRTPFEGLMRHIGRAIGRDIACIGESGLPDRLGKPDFAITVERLLSGYVELKAPGTGANPNNFTGHNRRQWNRFKAIPNLIYSDGNQWGLFRDGERIRPLVRLSGDVTSDGAEAVTVHNAKALYELVTDYLSWNPILPARAGRIDFRRFAELIAPLCRMLRDNVLEALDDPDSPLVQLARDWRQLLFPEATNEQFADAYAQTVTFALLLGRSEGADPLSLQSAQEALAADHALLSKALQILTDPGARDEISASLDLLLRVIAVVPVKRCPPPLTHGSTSTRTFLPRTTLNSGRTLVPTTRLLKSYTLKSA